MDDVVGAVDGACAFVHELIPIDVIVALIASANRDAACGCCTACSGMPGSGPKDVGGVDVHGNDAGNGDEEEVVGEVAGVAIDDGGMLALTAVSALAVCDGRDAVL